MRMLNLWAYRWLVGMGWQWVLERQTIKESQDEWLAKYRKDEPSITFVVSKSKPKKPPVGLDAFRSIEHEDCDCSSCLPYTY